MSVYNKAKQRYESRQDINPFKVTDVGANVVRINAGQIYDMNAGNKMFIPTNLDNVKTFDNLNLNRFELTDGQNYIYVTFTTTEDEDNVGLFGPVYLSSCEIEVSSDIPTNENRLIAEVKYDEGLNRITNIKQYTKENIYFFASGNKAITEDFTTRVTGGGGSSNEIDGPSVDISCGVLGAASDAVTLNGKYYFWLEVDNAILD